jgi:hypothetical protein
MSTIGKEAQDNKMTSSTESVETGTKSAEIKEQYKKFIGRKMA